MAFKKNWATVLSMTSVLALGSTALAAPAPVAPSKGSTPAKVCEANATRGKLSGAARQSFLAKCMKTVQSPPTRHPTLAANAVVSPAGQTPEQRSNSCMAEASRRKLSGPARQAFQHSCLAGVQAVGATQTALQTPPKRPAKAGLGVVANGKQH